MNFHLDMALRAPPEAIWPLFFDIGRVAALIPGCEQVEEKQPLARYGAVMKHKIGPFRMVAPTEVSVEEMTAPTRLRARAKGRDKLTGTTMDVLLEVALTPEGDDTRLVVDADTRIAGRLATLGYAVVKKKVEEMFAEFERRLRVELGLLEDARAAQPSPSVSRTHDASSEI
jgi:carbon monoxide dehydrogenase subunit G